MAFAKEFSIDYKLSNGPVPPFGEHSFDMVMTHGVLEHLHDSPRELLIDVLKLVRPEGYFFATVPNAVNLRKRVNVMFGKTNLPPFDSYYWYPGPWRGHVREYTKDDLLKLSEYLELNEVELRSCHFMLCERVPKAARSLYRSLTTIFPGWRDTWLLVAKKKPYWVPRRNLPVSELHKLLHVPPSCWS